MTKVLKVSISDFHKHKAVILDALATGRVELLVLRHGAYRQLDNIIDGVGVCTLDFIGRKGCQVLQEASAKPEIATLKNDHTPHTSNFSYILTSLGGYQSDFGADRRVNLSVQQGVVVPSFAFSYSKIEEFGFDSNAFEKVSLETLLPPSAPVDPAEVRELSKPGSRHVNLSETFVSAQLLGQLGLAPGERPVVIAVGPKDGEALQRLFALAAEAGATITDVVDVLEALRRRFEASDQPSAKPQFP
jgi:hypothetical protein